MNNNQPTKCGYTLKVCLCCNIALLGIAPSGSVMFVSQLYPGGILDKEITFTLISQHAAGIKQAIEESFWEKGLLPKMEFHPWMIQPQNLGSSPFQTGHAIGCIGVAFFSPS